MHGAHVRMHCMHVRMSRSATLRIALRGHEVISTCMQVLRSAVIVAGAVAWGSGLACMHPAVWRDQPWHTHAWYHVHVQSVDGMECHSTVSAHFRYKYSDSLPPRD